VQDRALWHICFNCFIASRSLDLPIVMQRCNLNQIIFNDKPAFNHLIYKLLLFLKKHYGSIHSGSRGNILMAYLLTNTKTSSTVTQSSGIAHLKPLRRETDGVSMLNPILLFSYTTLIFSTKIN